MRLYTIAFITWAASIATSESNVANLNGDKVVDYTEELRDLSAERIVEGIEARNFRQTNSKDYPNDAANVKLNKLASHADERRSNVISTTEFSPSKVVYATPLIGTAENYPFTEHLSQESEYAVSEDALLVENVGSFGQKVRQDYSTTVRTTNFRVTNSDQQSNKYTDFQQTSSSTASSLENGDNSERSHMPTTRVSAQKKKYGLSNNSPSHESKAIDSDIISKISGKTDNVSSVENNAAIENFPMSQLRLTRADSNTTSDQTTTKLAVKPEKTESATSTFVETNPSLQPGKFSGPIVVPDLPDREPEEEVDYVNDDVPDVFNDAEIIFSETGAEGSKIASNSITSSFMLNPLQVGIALVNANVADLTDDSDQSAATDTKNYVQNDFPLYSAPAENNGIQSSHVNNENSRHFDEGKPAENKLSDNSVEIQKSVELYHTAPIHEIHYPVEYVQHTSNGIIETNNIRSSQKSNHPYNQDERSNSQPNYDIYRDNNHEENVIKAHASTLSQKHNRHEYTTSNVGNKPTVPYLVTDLPSTNEQVSFEAFDLQPLRYNNAQPVLLVSRDRNNQFNDTIHDQSNVQYNFNGNDIHVSPHIKPAEIPARPEATNKLVKTHVPSTYQEERQPVDHQPPFRSLEAKRPLEGLQFLKIIPKGLSPDSGFLVPLPRPYPVEKIVEKTVHVPHPIEIEKVIEKKIPFPVERVIEKQVQIPIPIPQPYPVQVNRVAEKHIRVPYPINIDQIIDRRVPVHRFLINPPLYPLHVKQPVTYLTHMSPAPIDNPVERSPGFSQSYRPYRAEKTTDSGGLIIETKVNKYQSKSRKPVLNSETTNPRGSGLRFEPHQNETNVSYYYGDFYDRPLAYDNNVDVNKNYVPHFSDVRLILPKKFDSHVVLRSSLSKPVFLRQQVVVNLDKDKSINNEYTNLETSRKPSQGKGFQVKPSQLSTSAAQSSLITAVLRKSRQPENIGSFRQSKMEYGFKPPMIPSVQYDESTATKVDN
ncbi:uncharacterized protein LOC109857486 [Pseudomyrmex gracilis]|uniref:uncharacterized protein LOC109857486 n=1 Tax=Pseudomyrmex gracilis TaxID=219809 RepID=UPI000995393B|nr:uncharacterized protein LOC109857486 [Pseudomyrmex gracilis]